LVYNFAPDPKVNIMLEARITAIGGDGTVTGLTYTDASGKEHTLAVEGVFVAIGSIPNTEPVAQLITLDEIKAIPADRYAVTAVPGFFAAGDVTDIRDAQIVVAAGHGCSAALSAGDYLARYSITT
jgi:alkyl hydroperoxide reductase subunit F